MGKYAEWKMSRRGGLLEQFHALRLTKRLADQRLPSHRRASKVPWLVADLSKQIPYFATIEFAIKSFIRQGVNAASSNILSDFCLALLAKVFWQAVVGFIFLA